MDLASFMFGAICGASVGVLILALMRINERGED